MMASLPSPLPSDDVDQLSAFLDGELDDEGVRQVEDLLARDPNARAELQRLERAWHLLDGLPRAEANPEFTRTTVAMIAVRAADEVEPAPRAAAARRWPAMFASGVGLVAAVLVGFVAADRLWPHPNDQLLHDLPVIEHLDAYREAGNLEFLRKLKEQKLFSSTETAHAP
jgi:hypothetical protein